MTKKPDEIFQKLRSLFEECCPPLKLRRQKAESFEVVGRHPVKQEGKPVDGHHFAQVVKHGHEVRLSFFPLYTHEAYFENLSEPLMKARKTDHCFHLKHLDEVMEKDLREMIETGVRIYDKSRLL